MTPAKLDAMAHDALQQQLAFNDLIASILSRFASATGAEVDGLVRSSLRSIGEFVGVDYGVLIQTAPDFATWSATHEWCRPGIPSQLATHQSVPMGTYGWSEQALLAGRLVLFNCLDDTPPEAAETRRRWESLGFKSGLHLPLRGRGGQVDSCILLASLLREVTWSESDVQRLQLVGEAIVNALARKHVEQRLLESEARYRATFARAPVGILNVDTGGRLLEANQRFCDMLGYTHDELLGRHSSELTHPADCAAAAQSYQELLSCPQGVRPLEKRYLRKDGSIVWAKVTLSLLGGEPGEPCTVIVAVEDITYRKRAEEVFDAVPDLIFVLDRQHRIVRANRAAAERLGCDRQSLLGRTYHEAVLGTATAPDSCPHAQVISDGQERRFECHEPRLGGDFLVSCTPVRDAFGTITSSLHVARDVTELRQSEAALRRAHDELQRRRALVVAASLDGVWEWEAATDRVQYSNRFAELLGYTTDEIPQTLDFFRSALHPDDAAALWRAVDEHLDHDTPYDVECRLRNKAGEYRWFRTRGRAHRDPTGRPVWMAGSLQDIHEQKAAEMQLREALVEVGRLTARLRAENTYLQEEITTSQGFDEIVGQSELLRSTLHKIRHVAATDASVLLTGETGTGKELLARAVHNHSRRKDRPLVKVNLAALPSSLIESELFGHVKGAFTGAIADKVGRFALADGGTLFLDEIGELNPELQTKLLRVLQEGEFERIGSSETVKVDVRMVAATNRDLHRALAQGAFRSDLYYRLAVFPIEVPPLRLRREDIPLLVWHFILKKNARLAKAIDRVPEQTMNSLLEYDWPGNVRELENVIERAMILTPGSTLILPEPLRRSSGPSSTPALSTSKSIDRDRMLRVLEDCRWKLKGAGNAAERLGLKPSTLRYRMKVMGIHRPEGSNGR